MSPKDKLSMFLRETVQAFGIYNVCVREVLFLIVFMFSLCCSEKSTCGKQSGVGGEGKGESSNFGLNFGFLGASLCLLRT